MNKLILIGGGGHCMSCIDVIEQENKFQITGILDSQIAKDTLLSRYPVLGNDDMIEDLIAEGHYFLITVGQIKTPVVRKQIFEKLKERNAKIATVFSPLAYISQNAVIGEGTIILHGAVINAGINIGDNCIINTKALVEHDVKIGNHVHLSTGAIINGGCSVGNGSFVGSGAVLANHTVITENVVIGAGAVVVKNVLTEGVFAGNPAKRIK